MNRNHLPASLRSDGTAESDLDEVYQTEKYCLLVVNDCQAGLFVYLLPRVALAVVVGRQQLQSDRYVKEMMRVTLPHLQKLNQHHLLRNQDLHR